MKVGGDIQPPSPFMIKGGGGGAAWGAAVSDNSLAIGKSVGFVFFYSWQQISSQSNPLLGRSTRVLMKSIEEQDNSLGHQGQEIFEIKQRFWFCSSIAHTDGRLGFFLPHYMQHDAMRCTQTKLYHVRTNTRWNLSTLLEIAKHPALWLRENPIILLVLAIRMPCSNPVTL